MNRKGKMSRGRLECAARLLAVAAVAAVGLVAVGAASAAKPGTTLATRAVGALESG
jgi:hypothetical protein